MTPPGRSAPSAVRTGCADGAHRLGPAATGRTDLPALLGARRRNDPRRRADRRRDALPLTYDPAGLPGACGQFPHLAAFDALRCPRGARRVADAAQAAAGRGRLRRRRRRWSPPPACRSPACSTTSTPAPRTPTSGRPGAGRPTLALWAPTAQACRRCCSTRPGAAPERRSPMRRDGDGVWTVSGDRPGGTAATAFEVEVYVAETRRGGDTTRSPTRTRSAWRRTPRAPCSSTSTTAALKPAGWDPLRKPRARPSRRTRRSTSCTCATSPSPTPPCPAAQRGTYGLHRRDSNGMKHLRALAARRPDHVHLLPVFDFATIDERPRRSRSRRLRPARRSRRTPSSSRSA